MPTAMLRWALMVCVLSIGLAPTIAIAQDPASASLAAELAKLMEGGQLEALASKDTIDEDRFVAALAFPGQLLVVSARYEAPIYVEEKIANRQYRDVYIDLNAASIAGTKVLVTDVGANGLRGSDSSVDMFDEGGTILRLDGERSGGQMSASEYDGAVAAADDQYARMLRALIAEAQ